MKSTTPPDSAPQPRTRRPRTDFRAGYGRTELVPPLPFPLAGTINREDRLAGWVDDPPCATVVVLESGTERWALVGLDLLIVVEPLHDAVQEAAAEAGLNGAFVYASHTHSAMGGYVPTAGGRYFMGRHDPEALPFIRRRVADAMAAAVADLAPVQSLRHGRAEAAGITMNRRRRHGPTDDAVLVTELRRGRAARIRLVGVSGHPVAACFMEPGIVSSDYPGRLRRRHDAEGIHALVLPAALGGLNILFPEMPTNLQDHLDLIAGTLHAAVDRAVASAEPVETPVAVRHHAESLDFRQAAPPQAGGPPLVAARGWLWANVGSVYARFTAPAYVRVPAAVLRVGPVAFAGMPADFGVSATLILRDRLQRAGCATPYVVSHASGYVGYLHLRHEAAWQPTSDPWFHHYENAMAWYGRDATDRLMDAALRAWEMVK